MTKTYNQLTQAQRYKIETLLNAGKSQSEISSLIGVHKSTISRELSRNTPKRGYGAKVYVAENAQAKTDLRHQNKPKRIKFTDSLKNEMLDLMETKKYSPELVSAHWKRNNIQGVSPETQYQFLWNCKHTNQRKNRKYKKAYKLLKHLKRKRKRGNYKDSRGIIPNRVPITKRPKIVEKRKRFGDIETDLIIGKNHKSALLVNVDRASLLTTIDKVQGKNAKVICKKIIKRMKEIGDIKTITFDNDQAFSLHERVAKELGIKTYFTRPYTSQDKGTVENRNGVIRRFFPKKTDFNTISHWEIKRVEKILNDRPVRKFNYKTPNEVYLQKRLVLHL